MRKPFFSIVVPTYNREKMIGKCIESVIAQEFADWELVIVDDGSKDATEAVVKSYREPRIKYIYQDNAERSAARNNGIEHALGEYITFLDSDDYYLPQRLRLMHEFISKEALVSMYFTGISKIYVNEPENIEQLEVKLDRSKGLLYGICKAVIGTVQVCVHSSILQKYKFDTRISVGEDNELWLRIAQEFPVIHMPEQLTIMVVEHGGRTVSREKFDSYKRHIETYNYIFSAIKNEEFLKYKNMFLHDAYIGLANSYILNGMSSHAVAAILRASTYDFSRSLKKKVYLLMDNIFFLKPILSVRNLLRNKKT
jgi:glycosyltransferase involved in cell wall biosynthesis